MTFLSGGMKSSRMPAKVVKMLRSTRKLGELLCTRNILVAMIANNSSRALLHLELGAVWPDWATSGIRLGFVFIYDIALAY
jgi:hypothetical protein